MLLWRYMAIVALLAIASIPWLATAQATGKLVGYTNTAAVPALEQVQFNGDLQVAYGIKDGTLYILNMRDVITAALAGTEASAPNMEVLNTTTPGFPIQDVSFCSSAKGSFVAIATEGATKVDLGYVIVYRTTSDPRTLTEVARVRVGALPDQLTFRKEDDDCAQILVANEGEPLTYTPANLANDPEGSISVIDMKYKKGGKVELKVATADFKFFIGQEKELNKAGVRIFGPGASVAQDLEPECVTYSEDGKFAYASLQENNGLAVINLKGKDGPEVVSLLPLGMADYSVGNPNNNALDPSDSDNSNNDNSFNDDPKIRQWPVFGMYQPDEIEAFNHRGATYLVLANEGDARAWGSFREDKRLRSFTSPRLDRTEFPNFADLEDNKALGRLQISTVDDTGSEISSGVSTIRAFGARSFSILRMNSKSTGYRMVYNSGSLLENLTSTVLATSTTGACPTSPSTKRGFAFNYGDAQGCYDSRSDDKGPEPEGLHIAYVDGKRLLLLTLERADLVAVFDISDPRYPKFLYFLQAPVANPKRWTRPEGVTFGKVKVKNANPPRRTTRLNLVLTAWEALAPDDNNPNGVGGCTVHLLPGGK